MGFSRQEHWNVLPRPASGDLPDLSVLHLVHQLVGPTLVPPGRARHPDPPQCYSSHWLHTIYLVAPSLKSGNHFDSPLAPSPNSVNFSVSFVSIYYSPSLYSPSLQHHFSFQLLQQMPSCSNGSSSQCYSKTSRIIFLKCKSLHVMSLVKTLQRFFWALWMNKTSCYGLKDSTSVRSPCLPGSILHHTPILSLHASHSGLALVTLWKCFYLAMCFFEHAVLLHCNLAEPFEREVILY